MTREELSVLAVEKGDEIYGFCYYLSGNKHIAEELYQDTFLKAVEKRHKINNGIEAKSYLIGIAAKLWKNNVRKNNNRNRIVPVITNETAMNNVPDHENILETLIHDERKSMVYKGVEGLESKYRIVVVMYYYGNLSVEDIGKALNIPKGTVKSRLHKSRQIMKKYLEETGYEYGY